MEQHGNAIRIHPTDSVALAVETIPAGTDIRFKDDSTKTLVAIPGGHKVALRNIAVGEHVIKYGYPIGHATEAIAAGGHIHTHNIKTNLKGVIDYEYKQSHETVSAFDIPTTFNGYLRANGDVGIRNEVWIINTVGCVNKTAELLARESEKRFAGRSIDGVFAFPHPYGCSQLGEDHSATQTILADLVRHPNAGAVLVLGLGCENNNIAEFQKVLGEWDEARVKFVDTQSLDDEIEDALAIIDTLVAACEHDKRETVPVSKLRVGLKCGGSDGFSGITANPLVGVFSDMITAGGGTSVLTEVPEMFGAETILMNRACDESVFQKEVEMINGFKSYFMRYNQEVYENPSPGNKEGGITTLEEKSLGCVQKGGHNEVVDVLPYGGVLSKPGLNLLDGPGNDMVAVTALAAAGCHIILFTTGRGTPLGAPVPTVKVSSNSDLAARKKNWIDFNAGKLLEGESMDSLGPAFFDYVLSVANGELTKNERYGYREIAIFKDGVTL